jgi:hypothetical protein
MKNTIKTLAAVIILLTISATALVGKNKDLDTADFIVNGIILKTNKKLDSKCTLELFYENTIVNSKVIQQNKPFEFKLKKNTWYTIRVTKEGFVPLLISFNTALENNDIVENNLFQFETELIDLEKAKYMDRDLIDFPVGLVAYNKETQRFEARDLYTQNYISGLNKTNTNNPDVAKEYVSRANMKNDLC